MQKHQKPRKFLKLYHRGLLISDILVVNHLVIGNSEKAGFLRNRLLLVPELFRPAQKAHFSCSLVFPGAMLVLPFFFPLTLVKNAKPRTTLTRNYFFLVKKSLTKADKSHPTEKYYFQVLQKKELLGHFFQAPPTFLCCQLHYGMCRPL
jgi:hypothetical protein